MLVQECLESRRVTPASDVQLRVLEDGSIDVSVGCRFIPVGSDVPVMTSHTERSRRTLLAGIGTVAVGTTLAGCGGPGGDEDVDEGAGEGEEEAEGVEEEAEEVEGDEDEVEDEAENETAAV
ncbi:hypothetical protein OB955_18830 [Halobacteria archaeon AArc-m2/3/4]|uniref:Uncharacterized protein n=1 Tax=Natronoglomus mannanivorans TaxID=2979990 RepID=A0ABT2QIR7_9EURY|nr:hypothetical protein [Halobacteria archaeon AArc-m2/3/4]